VSLPHPALAAPFRAAIPIALAVSIAACGHANRERVAGVAKDEWTRSYPLAEGGSVSFVNNQGSIEIEGVGGLTSVEVRIERIAHAASEAAARDLLQKIAFKTEGAPDRVLVETEGVAGVLIGVSFETHYRVRVPAAARVRAETSRAPVKVSNTAGRLAVVSRNGSVTGVALRGPIDIRTGGDVTLDIQALGGETDQVLVRLTPSGKISVALPHDANATLSATTTAAGRATVKGLPFEPIGEPDPPGRQRRLRGRINKGGAPVELSTAARDIDIYPRGEPAP
jgi:hypothetical protein